MSEVARERMAAAFKIFVYCDDESHPKRVAVTNFIATPDGGWHERLATRARVRGHIGTGRQMLNDAPAHDGWALEARPDDEVTRARFELECRKCHRSAPARQENLFPVLDGWKSSAVSEVSLTLIAASMGRARRD